MVQKIWSKISQSVYDHLGKISQVRVQSYFILAEIIITGLFFLLIEAANAYLSIWVKSQPYTPTKESIFIFGMILSHHLVMLGLKMGSEQTAYPSLDKKTEADVLIADKKIDSKTIIIEKKLDNDSKLNNKCEYNANTESAVSENDILGDTDESAKNLRDL